MRINVLDLGSRKHRLPALLAQPGTNFIALGRPSLELLDADDIGFAVNSDILLAGFQDVTLMETMFMTLPAPPGTGNAPLLAPGS